MPAAQVIDPFSQATKRSDPVYLANSTVFYPPPPPPQQHQHHHQQQEPQQQQQSCQPQFHQLHQMHQPQWMTSEEPQRKVEQEEIPDMEDDQHLTAPYRCEVMRGQILKRVDLIPVQHFPM